MNKRFDGILICTDMDGTLAYRGQISKNNADAIRYFQEQGGIFTVISGRYPNFYNELRDFVFPKAPLCGMNGSAISDMTTGTLLFESTMGKEELPYVLSMLQKVPDVVSIYLQMKSGTFHSPVQGGIPTIPFPDNICDIYKILFVVPDEASDKSASIIKQCSLGRYEVSRSWINGIEIQKHGIDKGSAVRFVKEQLKGQITYTIGVGDFENDIPLLLASDLKVAEQDAFGPVKEIADRITTSCQIDSIAKIIESL